ncbi:hypothetical protein ABVK25_006687 [Lepraria finkii]|uniref:Uncharacterized protein n=1 Tax=Lepraria finkii TaxID=1340010 RepID=A0ABR4B5K5_9LECA
MPNEKTPAIFESIFTHTEWFLHRSQKALSKPGPTARTRNANHLAYTDIPLSNNNYDAKKVKLHNGTLNSLFCNVHKHMCPLHDTSFFQGTEARGHKTCEEERVVFEKALEQMTIRHIRISLFLISKPSI